MKFSKLALVSSLFALSFGFISCSSTKKSGEAPKSADTDQKSAQTQPVVTQNPSSSASLNVIYFDFNKYVIREDQQAVAKSLAESLKTRKVGVRIEGNTDDRGSVEYNLALGTKRAESLKKYLQAQGVTSKISTVSYGKERPAVQGADESAWSKNRRDDVVEVN